MNDALLSTSRVAASLQKTNAREKITNGNEIPIKNDWHCFRKWTRTGFKERELIDYFEINKMDYKDSATPGSTLTHFASSKTRCI